MTTVGYGDVTPLTQMGKVFAIVSGVCGIILASLSVALLSRSLNLTKKEKQMVLFMQECSRGLAGKEMSVHIFQICQHIMIQNRRFNQLYDRRLTRGAG
eukprot:gene14347-26920_t